MARQIYSFTVTVPAGTTKAAPQRTALTIPTRQVDEVEIRVPPGPLGNLGIALAVSGTQVIPYNVGEWIVTDDEVIRWPLDGYPDSGAWSLIAYNTGAYPHSVQVRLLTSLPPAETPGPPVPLDTSSLSGVVDLSVAPVPIP